MHQRDAALERLEPSSGERKGVGVAVDTDEMRLRVCEQQCLGMPGQAECRVDDDGAGAGQRGGEEFENAAEQDRHVPIRTRCSRVAGALGLGAVESPSSWGASAARPSSVMW